MSYNMSRILIVNEHESITVGDKFCGKDKIITKLQADYIEKWERKQKKSIFKWGNNRLIPQQWVGVLSIPNLQIEILPKIELKSQSKIRNNLLYMLSIAGEIPIRENEVGDLHTSNSTVLECYVKFFVKKLQKLVRQGLTHQYSYMEENSNFFKGKLLIPQQLRKNICNRSKFYIKYDEFSIDNKINRILKATIVKLIGITTNQETSKYLYILKSAFSEIDEKRFHITDLMTFKVPKSYQQYEQLLEMCKLFWQEQLPDFHTGETKMFSFLFDMNKIYERFIQKLIKRYQESVFKNEHYHIGMKKSFLFSTPLNQKAFRLIPDNVIFEGVHNKIIKIIDTKWKTLDDSRLHFGIKQADIYQMYAYAREFDCKDIVLLYPGKKLNTNQTPLYFNNTFTDREIRLFIGTIDLSVNLPRELNKIFEELSEYLSTV